MWKSNTNWITKKRKQIIMNKKQRAKKQLIQELIAKQPELAVDFAIELFNKTVYATQLTKYKTRVKSKHLEVDGKGLNKYHDGAYGYFIDLYNKYGWNQGVRKEGVSGADIMTAIRVIYPKVYACVMKSLPRYHRQIEDETIQEAIEKIA